MRIIRNTILVILVAIVGVILDYSLPRHDVVRVVGTYQERQDLESWTRIFWSSPDYQSGIQPNRDVQFIQAYKKKTYLFGFIRSDAERPMVYRNEDTSWSWPPYFKFDTATLQAEADNLKSTEENPKWAVITKYGWRIQLFTAFPNAMGIRAAATPDVTIIPWFNIFFFTAVFALFLFVRAMWRQFRERTIDPALEDTRDAWEKVDDFADEKRGRLRRWWHSWTGR